VSAQCLLDLAFEILSGVPVSEHLADIHTVGLCELPRRLPVSFLVKDPLHRIEYIAAIFRGGKTG